MGWGRGGGDPRGGRLGIGELERMLKWPESTRSVSGGQKQTRTQRWLPAPSLTGMPHYSEAPHPVFPQPQRYRTALDRAPESRAVCTRPGAPTARTSRGALSTPAATTPALSLGGAQRGCAGSRGRTAVGAPAAHRRRRGREGQAAGVQGGGRGGTVSPVPTALKRGAGSRGGASGPGQGEGGASSEPGRGPRAGPGGVGGAKAKKRRGLEGGAERSTAEQDRGQAPGTWSRQKGGASQSLAEQARIEDAREQCLGLGRGRDFWEGTRRKARPSGVSLSKVRVGAGPGLRGLARAGSGVEHGLAEQCYGRGGAGIRSRYKGGRRGRTGVSLSRVRVGAGPGPGAWPKREAGLSMALQSRVKVGAGLGSGA